MKVQGISCNLDTCFFFWTTHACSHSSECAGGRNWTEKQRERASSVSWMWNNVNHTFPKKGWHVLNPQNHLLVREEISHNWIHPQEYPPPFDQSCIYIGKTITASVVTWLEREIPGLGAMNGLYYHGCTYKDIHYILLMEKILLTSWGWQFIIHCLRRVLAPSKTVVVRYFWTMEMNHQLW